MRALFVAGRRPLSLLASMPAGNVAGLIDLEGEPAQAFGGGEHGAHDAVGSGSERVARLSEAAANAIQLPWRCRLRLVAGSVLLKHWKVWYTIDTAPCVGPAVCVAWLLYIYYFSEVCCCKINVSRLTERVWRPAFCVFGCLVQYWNETRRV